MSDRQRIEITMASRVEYVNLIHAASDEVCRLLDLDEDWAMNFGLALHEAAVNAIKHGNREDAEKKVFVVFSIGPGELEVTISDQGNGFDVSRAEDPRAMKNIDRTSGRGLFLIRNFVDQVTFTHIPGQGLVVSLVKRLPVAEKKS